GGPRRLDGGMATELAGANFCLAHAAARDRLGWRRWMGEPSGRTNSAFRIPERAAVKRMHVAWSVKNHSAASPPRKRGSSGEPSVKVSLKPGFPLSRE